MIEIPASQILSEALAEAEFRNYAHRSGERVCPESDEPGHNRKGYCLICWAIV